MPDAPPTIRPNPIPGGNNTDFDLFGVSKWDNEDNFTLLKYYTLVDDISLKTPNVSVIIKSEGKVSTSVAWIIDGVNYESIRFDESTAASDELTVTTFYPYLDEDFEYAGGMEILALAKVATHRIERKAVIHEEARIRDVLCVDFGMSSEEVALEIELLRGEGKFTMRDASIGIENIAPHFAYAQPGRTLYIFDRDELVEVAEFPYSVFDDGGRVSYDFTDFCKRVGMPGDNIPTEDGLLLRNLTWERDGVRYTVYMRDDVFPDPEGDGTTQFLPHSIGISYELI
ncbi:MAG: hypothetical protein LIO77_05650 [Rikenellaceae bacterium]|nr:hypothetical protein [Rikenellaceae bacterium]